MSSGFRVLCSKVGRRETGKGKWSLPSPISHLPSTLLLFLFLAYSSQLTTHNLLYAELLIGATQEFVPQLSAGALRMRYFIEHGQLPELQRVPDLPRSHFQALQFVPSAAGVPPGSSTNRRVNDRSKDIGLFNTQSETTIALFGQKIFCGYNTSASSKTSFSGFAYSLDGGQSFVDGGVVLASAPFIGFGDPVLVVNSAGVFYYAMLGGAANGDNGVFVASTTASGTAFNTAIPVSTNTKASAIFNDKEWIAIDRTGGTFNNRIYVSWTKFTNLGLPGQTSNILLSFSQDKGITWSAPILVSPSTNTQGSQVAVGPNGEVYVSWSDVSSTIKFAKSSDGGATFSVPQTVTGVTSVGKIVNGGFRMDNFPRMAVDTTLGANRGNIYIVWNDKRLGTPKIFFTRSTDGGITWNTPNAVVNETDKDQLQPALAVDANGIIHLIWYDRRLDPDNLMLDLYYTFSTDGGATFAPSARITNVSFPVIVGKDPAINATYMGDYIQVAPGAGNAFALWGDNRSGDPDVYFDVVSPNPALGNLARVFSFPNPFRPQDDGQVVFRLPNFSENVQIRIFNLAGELVRTIKSDQLSDPFSIASLTWDGKNDDGNPVASGIYLYAVSGKNLGSVLTGKLTLIK